MLPYGLRSLSLFGPVLGAPRLERPEPPAMPDPARACALALAHPAGRPPLATWIRAGERIGIVIPDLTRHLAPQLLEATVEQVRAAGATPFVRIANGTHRRLTVEELARLVPASLGVEAGDRDCDDPSAHAALGTTASGLEARIDAEAARADRLVLLGPVSFHYLAGFGGGSKLLAPGLADRATAEGIHRRFLDPSGERHPQARMGAFPHENPMHRAIAEVAKLAPPLFSAVTQQNAHGRLVGVFAGEPALAHHHACLALEGHYVIETPRLQSVIVSSGGAPYDGDVVQAHKALEAVAPALEPGGRVVWIAAMTEGVLARARPWLGLRPEALETQLRARFDINGYTLLALRRKAERFAIRAVTELSADACAELGITKAASLEDALAWAWIPGRTAVVPWGARFLLCS